MSPLLVLRPEPGAGATLAGARTLGLEAIVAPLFTIVSCAWEPPAARHDALLLTSANALRHAGPALASYHALPVHAVGEATAAAARAAGFTRVTAGIGDVTDLLAAMAAAGIEAALHLAGRDHRAVGHPALRITRAIVYAANPVAALPDAARAVLGKGAVALIHSPLAGALLSRLAEEAGVDRARAAVAAISPAAAAAAGLGWRAVASAARPDDAALLAVAARLCE